MKVLNLVLSLIACSMTAVAANAATAQTARTYQSAQGTIDLARFRQTLEQRVGGPVSITNIRWSYNPLDYGNYAVTALEGSPFAAYVIDFYVGIAHDSDHVTCDFAIIPKSKQALVYNCESDSGTVTVPGFISYQELGL